MPIRLQPPETLIGKWFKIASFSLAALGAAAIMALMLMPDDMRTYFLLQGTSVAQAGTWEDDPYNWRRAFNEEVPAEVKVIHSKYWRSDHFTDEFIYYFEIQATPEWTEAFLRKRRLEHVPPAATRGFSTNQHSDSALTPNWFVPGPAERYDVWDKAGDFGPVLIDRTNGHVFFHAIQL